MQEYNAPIEDILFVIENLSSDIKSTNEEYSDPDLLKQIFEEAGKFSSNVLAPLNPIETKKVYPLKMVW